MVIDLNSLDRPFRMLLYPLIVDNTFATPILCRPIEWGADIVVHSTSKYMDGHAVQVGGVIVDSGKFDWKASGKFPGLCEPDDSYHGVVYTETFKNMAYIVKARAQLMRDLGCMMSPNSAFILNMNMETLPIRMARHCENALAVAKYLENHPKIEWVNYPGLESNKYHELAKKYLPNGCSAIIAYGVKGGKESAKKFLENLKLASLEIHVADIRTCCLHPANATHRQMNDKQLEAAGIPPTLIRYSCGLENADDLIEDLNQALNLI